MITELLQATGLNKYEAEAYHALLRAGPLTGYELGKRSEVPLSRSYEVLERLVGKGLALVQPGDPPRYAAEPPEQFLARTRSVTTARLDALAQALAELGQSHIPGGFWVARGRAAVLEHGRTLIGGAEQSVMLSVAPDYAAALEPQLSAARAAGRRVTIAPAEADAAIVLLADGSQALAGTLAPADDCQAVASANPALVAAIGRFFTPRLVSLLQPAREPAPQPGEAGQLSWLDWEQRKQRRLLAERRGA